MSPPIIVGQFFHSFDSLKTAIQDWSIQDKFTLRTRLRDRQRVDFGCHAHREECAWRVFATTKGDRVVQIRIINH